MIHPDPVHRVVSHRPDKYKYEVLAEMTAMWKQAWQAGTAAATEAEKMSEPDIKTAINLQRLVATRETWKQAIMVFAGWNDSEVGRYVEEVKEDDKQ